ncbi:helix-turn-helix transcriptional regulator [Pseudomonas fluorescens]|nr:DNA-binding protein [Pseudomonas fluorescens]
MDYIFTLKYQLAQCDCDPDELVERLYAAGCDDALIGVGLPGRLALEFTREAATAETALRSALMDVKRIVPDARLVEVAPDFVGLTDIAEIIGVSRQNMRKLMLTHCTSFPLAVHEGKTSVWHLAEVLSWLDAKGGYRLEQPVIDVARIAQSVNLVKESRRGVALGAEWRALV